MEKENSRGAADVGVGAGAGRACGPTGTRGEEIVKGQIERPISRAEEVVDPRRLTERACGIEMPLDFFEVIFAGRRGIDEVLLSGFKVGELRCLVEFEVDFLRVKDLKDDDFVSLGTQHSEPC